MKKDEIQNLIKDLVEKITLKANTVSVTEEGPKSMWVAIEVDQPHLFISRDGEGLQALNHVVHRIIENKMPKDAVREEGLGILIDINGFQKKKVDSVRAVAHMMSERARYFKSNIEIDPMSAFERRIVHEFLSDAADLKTESVGTGPTRRVVIKYVGAI